MAGARGVQLAEVAIESARTGGRRTIPDLVIGS
jgi:hypothetical protein